MRRLAIGIAAGLVCGGALADQATPLKSGPGSDATATKCSVCHTSDYIVMNSMFLSPEGWRAEVTKMRSAFGASIDDAMAEVIISYLSLRYGVAGKP